jgi:hypothetical protein
MKHMTEIKKLTRLEFSGPEVKRALLIHARTHCELSEDLPSWDEVGPFHGRITLYNGNSPLKNGIELQIAEETTEKGKPADD